MCIWIDLFLACDKRERERERQGCKHKGSDERGQNVTICLVPIESKFDWADGRDKEKRRSNVIEQKKTKVIDFAHTNWMSCDLPSASLYSNEKNWINEINCFPYVWSEYCSWYQKVLTSDDQKLLPMSTQMFALCKSSIELCFVKWNCEWTSVKHNSTISHRWISWKVERRRWRRSACISTSRRRKTSIAHAAFKTTTTTAIILRRFLVGGVTIVRTSWAPNWPTNFCIFSLSRQIRS